MANQITPTALSRSDKPGRKQIRGKLKAALEAMVWDGLDWDEAARNAKLTTAAMRKALGKAHVIAFLKHEREVLRASMGGKTLVRLAELRDQDENRNAAVKACQVIEQLGETDSARGAGIGLPRAPGLVIQIISAPSHVARSAQFGAVIDHDEQTASASPGERELPVLDHAPYHAPRDMAAAPFDPAIDRRDD
jgi:hypothetical protein